MRIRLTRLILDGIRNVRHGGLDFDDLDTGGSITGVYGQNGSGKTSVIDSIRILRDLMAGRKLVEGSSDMVNSDTNRATITAIYRITDKTGETSYVEYAVTLTGGYADRNARVEHESLRVSHDRNHLGRIILERTHDDGQSRKLPVYVWRSLLSIPAINRDMEFFDRASQFDGMSFLFAPYRALSDMEMDGGLMLKHFIDAAKTVNGISAQTIAYLEDKLEPAVVLLQQLVDYANHGMHVYATRFSDLADNRHLQVMNMKTDQSIILNLMESTILSNDLMEQIREAIGTYNQLLSTLVPNLQLRLSENPAQSDNQGNPQTRVELMSSRGGASFPFRNESEGIIRLVRLLPFFVRVYNNPNVLTAIDDIDTGMSEKLLGDMFRQLVSGIHGQLIFTANNLRLFELLPGKCLRTTVTDVYDRFSRGPKIRPTNNGRSVYLTTTDIGWDGPDLYENPPARMFANMLFLADHPEEGE